MLVSSCVQVGPSWPPVTTLHGRFVGCGAAPRPGMGTAAWNPLRTGAASTDEEAMTRQVNDMKIAILVDDLFEQAELAEPRKALQAAGATVHIISPKGPQV